MNKIQLHDSEVAICSDFHLGVHSGSAIWHTISLDFAKWLKQVLNKQGIQDLIICGDIMNDRNFISVLTIHTATEFFKILKDFNIIILVGNHDAHYKERSDVNSIDILNEWKNISIINEITAIEAFNKTITFVPWASNLDDIPSSDLIFGHFEISNFKMNKNKICSSGINSADLLAKAPLIISGHFHYRDERHFKDGTILYTGNPYELNWGDSSITKGIYLLDLKTMQYNFIANETSPKHIKFRLSELLNPKTEMVETLKRLAPGNLVNLLIDKEISTDKVDALISKISVLQPLSIQTEFFNVSNYDVEDLNYEFTGIDIPAAIEEFINMIEIKNKSEVLNYTLDLLKRV